MTDIKNKDVSRRTVLKGAAVTAAAAAVPSIYIPSASAAFRNDPTSRGSVVFGFNIPQTGAYAEEGADELRGYELAVKHINGGGDGGMLNTMKPLALKGNGILGKKVEYVVGDTKTNAKVAVASAQALVDQGAIMISGGSSSGVAIAVQAACQDMGIINMHCLTHSNATTGKERKKMGFRYFFNAHQSGIAIAPVLNGAYGADRQCFHVTSDYSWGWSVEESITKAMAAEANWGVKNAVLNKVGEKDFSGYIQQFMNSGADVLVLNNYGGDLVRSLKAAEAAGVRDKVVNGKQVQIVAPLFSRVMAQGAGTAIQGVYGSANWNWKLTDEGSQAFVKSFGMEYGFPPSQAAHTAYVQTLLYADACERAGTFDPMAVAAALENFEFDGMGNGKSLYRAEDHQVLKNALVVQGNENPTSSFDLLNVVEVTGRDRLDFDHNTFPGTL